jgi:type II secretory pathway pseudopilin PulG
MSRLALRARLVRRLRGSADDGFVLLESMVAITIITIIMGALGVAFLGTMASASQQRAKQTAVQVADSTMANLRSIDPSSILSGRGQTSVSNQFSAGGGNPVVAPWLQSMDQAWDTSAALNSGTTTATAAVPTQPQTVKPAQLAYSVSQYIGYCYLPSDASSTDCVPKASVPAGKTPVQYLRAVVAVSWSAPHCTPTSCSYVSASLLSPSVNPIFKINQPLPAAPVLPATMALTYAVGDSVSYQFAVNSGTGVPSFTWALKSGSLPNGLTLSVLGLLSGSPAVGTGTGSGTNYTMTLQVTDMFLRQTTTQLTITVLPPLQISNCPNTMASTTADTTFSPGSFTATGGAGSPYTWTATGLPAGVTLSSGGTLGGQPSTVGTFPVKVQVTDSGKARTAACSFNWTVTYPPLAASNPGSLKGSLTAAASMQLSASGGSGGGYQWTATGLPAGITISSGGLMSGTPTTAGASSVTATVTDPTAGYTQSVTFTWTVYAAPTVTSPGNQTTGTGRAVNLQLATSCPNAPCSYAISGGPAGLTISNTGKITGTVSGVQSYPTATITVTDASGATATTAPFAWNVVAVPTITDPGPQATAPKAATALQLQAAGGTGALTFSASGLPGWLTLSPSGRFAGTVPSGTPLGTGYTFTVTVTDGTGMASDPLTMNWYVDTLAWSGTPTPSTKRGRAGSLDLSGYVTGGTGGNVYALVSAPGWSNMKLTGSIISFTAPGSAGSQPFTVSVTDKTGYSVQLTFTWTIT